MHLTIEDVIPSGKTPSSYEVVVRTFQGDGDGDKDIVIGPFNMSDLALLEDLLLTLERIQTAFPQIANGNNYFDNVEGFLAWFNFERIEKERMRRDFPSFKLDYDEYAAQAAKVEAFKLAHDIDEEAISWPMDPISDWEDLNSFKEYNVFYYDENLAKYKVSVHASL